LFGEVCSLEQFEDWEQLLFGPGKYWFACLGQLQNMYCGQMLELGKLIWWFVKPWSYW